ncbi:MAG: SDR family NAD(P)-dependent oxidoreductase [Acidimicrobiales bacterium]
MANALITGGSRGLGLALAKALAHRGWGLILDARGAEELGTAAGPLERWTDVRAIAGDVADPNHREALVSAVNSLGGLDALVNNASLLGPSPQPKLADYPLAVLVRVYEVNVFSPLALIQALLPHLRKSGGRILSVTSDAAAEAYPGWGGYGSSKAALEQLTQVLEAEEPGLRVYRVDPGDLRTRMHQEAFPGEDISDRPPPEAAVPGLLQLLEADLPSGRYRAQELGADLLA